MSLYSSPVITRSSALDNPSEDDHELLTITSLATSSVLPSYVKIISDNITTNQLSQKIIPLKNDDYTLNGSTYSINVLFDVRSNQQYTLKAKVIYSDGNFSSYSSMYTFTSAPTVPVILCAFGTSQTSIFLRINPQSEVESYTAVLTYLDYNSNKQLDVVESLYASGCGRFIELPNLLQNVEYLISIYANNSNGQSYLSNSVSSTTKPQPLPVTNLQAEFDLDAYVSLSWTEPDNSVHLPIDNYIIQDGSGNELTTVSGNSTSYNFPMPSDLNQSYSFQLIAVHISNGQSYLSNPSTSVSINIPEPHEVQNLHITSIDPSTLLITINWDSPSNNAIIRTTSYNILLNGNVIQNTGANGFNYNGVPNQTYSFSIIPLHNTYSASGQANTINAQIPLPGAPRNLVASFNQSCDIELTWSAPCNNSTIITTSYNVYDGSNNLITNVSTTSYTLYDQNVGQAYAFYVKSVHALVEGLSSMTYNLSIPLPSAPINITSSFDARGYVTVYWKAPISSPVFIDQYKVFDITTQRFRDGYSSNTLDPDHFDSNLQQYHAIQTFIGVHDYPPGSSYSFYVVACHKNAQSVISSQTTVTIPIPSVPRNLSAVINPTGEPTASLSWDLPANNSTISTDSFNVYQDGSLIQNVAQTSFESGVLIAGVPTTFIIKPLHANIEYESPASITITPFQSASAPTNFVAQPKNEILILSWSDPLNIGGGTPTKYVLSYGSTSLDIAISPGSYSQTISGLTNKSTYVFSLKMITNSNVNGATATLSAIPTGIPIINSINLTNGVLTVSIDQNGSSLVDNYTVVSYNSSNIPMVSFFNTPLAVNGIVSISQSLGVSSKATLIVANIAGLSATSTQ